MKQVGSAVISPPANPRPDRAWSQPVHHRAFPSPTSHRSQGSTRRSIRGNKRAPLPAVSVPADWAKAAPLPGRTAREDRPLIPSTAAVPGQTQSLSGTGRGERAERLGRLVVRVLLFWSLASLIWSLAGGWN